MGSEALPADLARDVEAIAKLPAVQTILRVIAETTGLGFTLVARVTDEHWVACAVHDEISFGMKPGATLELSTTLCETVRDTHAPVVMNHASLDPMYSTHPTPKLYGFESYISVPLYGADGAYFGTLCGLDPKPSLVDQPRVRDMFRHFSELISLQLAAEERHRETSARLLDAEETAQLREQFVAVLGHDLRNPLGAISMAAQLILGRSIDDGTRKYVDRIERSARRITEMVDALLDLARAKLGSGIGIKLQDVTDLHDRLGHVVAELRSVHPGRELNVAIAPLGTVRCDPERIARVLSNLLSNALSHGAPGRPVTVDVRSTDGKLVLSVHNEGPPIPAETRAHLFEPYTRGGATGARSGLGLGLYIVERIAHAHGGTIEVTSDETGTRFVLTMPV